MNKILYEEDRTVYWKTKSLSSMKIQYMYFLHSLKFESQKNTFLHNKKNLDLLWFWIFEKLDHKYQNQRLMNELKALVINYNAREKRW